MTLSNETTERSIAASRRMLATNALVGGASNITKILLQILLLPIMARLLGPAEFGLYALALPTVSFFTVLADGGLGISLAREDESASLLWSTAFWVLLIAGIGLCALVTGWGFVLAALSHAPKLPGIMTVLSFSFLLIALSTLPIARLTRSGNLVLYAVADLVAALVGAAVAITFALLDAGAMSLALQYLSTYLVRASILNAFAFRRPGLEFQISTLRGHLQTGGYLLGGRLVEFSSRLMENLSFGRIFGAAALGTYTFANQVPRFICEAASNPSWSALYSHALQERADTLGDVYLRLCRLLASLVFPIAFLLSASAAPLIYLCLGPKWASAAPLIQILVPSYAVAAVASQSTAILLSNGRNGSFLIIITGLSVGRLLAVLSGYWLSAEGVAWGITITNLLYATALFLASVRLMAIGVRTVQAALTAPLVSSCMAGGVCALTLAFLPYGPLETLLGLGAGALAFCAIMIVMEGALVRADLLTLRQMVRRRSDSG